MKIILAAPHFPPRFIGGVEVYVKRLADGFVRLGDEPTVIAVEAVDQPSGVPRIDVDTECGYPVHRISVDLAKQDWSLAFHYGTPLLDGAIGTILASVKPDIVHLHSGYLLGTRWLTDARVGGASTLLSLHDYWTICPRITLTHPDGRVCSGPDSVLKCAWCLATERRRYRVVDAATGGLAGRTVARLGAMPAVASRAERTTGAGDVAARQRELHEQLSEVDVLIAPSRFMRDRVVAAGMPESRIVVIPNSVSSSITRRGTAQVNAVRRFGFLGQIAPHKGLHVLIDALRLVPGASLTLAIHGDPTRSPDYVADLRARAAGDPRITFAGPYASDAVDSVLSTIDVVVVPSVWYENAPFVILEAQRAGLPVLASRLGGMQELVTDERDGLLARAGDAADFARQLTRLLDPAMLCTLAASAPPVQTFDEELADLRRRYAALRSERKVRESGAGGDRIR